MGRRKFELRDAQKQTLQALIEHPEIIILKARQIGYSTLVSAWVLWRAVFLREERIIMLSKNENEAIDLLSKVKYMWDHMPAWAKERVGEPETYTQKKIEWAKHYCSIESLPSKESPARGRTVTLIILDEWAFFQDPDDAWASVEPTTDLGGRLIVLSTANGAGTTFHKQVNAARLHQSGLFFQFIPFNAVPERGADWIATKRAKLLDWQFHQEYPSDADEAFIQSGNPVMDRELLDKQPIQSPQSVGELFLDEYKVPHYLPSETGALKVWHYPLPMHRYVIGVDVAEGLEHGDYSSVHVIDDTVGHVVATWHDHIDADVLGAEIVYLIARWYNTAYVGIEANNHGHATLRALQRKNYPRIHIRRNLDSRQYAEGKITEQLGWLTTLKTKPEMVTSLIAALRDDSLLIYDEDTVEECRLYRRDQNGRMGGSPHDDRVMSCGIAQVMRRYSMDASGMNGDEAAAWGTMQWWNDLMEESLSGEDDVIGHHSVRKSRV